MIYFTSDTHFGHKNILEFCQRPFADVIEMREKLIKNINEVVGQTDELWHLGDVALGLHRDSIKEIMDRIVCKNTRLICGNHDSHKDTGSLFQHCYDAKIIKWNHQRFFLCHFPLMSWATHFQLHGHWHGKGTSLHGQLDVGVDSFDFKPISIEQAVATIQKRDMGRMVKASTLIGGR